MQGDPFEFHIKIENSLFSVVAAPLDLYAWVWFDNLIWFLQQIYIIARCLATGIPLSPMNRGGMRCDVLERDVCSARGSFWEEERRDEKCFFSSIFLGHWTKSDVLLWINRVNVFCLVFFIEIALIIYEFSHKISIDMEWWHFKAKSLLTEMKYHHVHVHP